MRVTFRKTGPRRYGVFVERDRAPVLAKDSAPGFDEHVPHDLLHFVAEAELGLDRRIFGDLAAGGNARIFIPVDKRLVARMWRAQRIRKRRLPDGRRSEQPAGELERACKSSRYRPELAPIVQKLDDLPPSGTHCPWAARSHSSGRARNGADTDGSSSPDRTARDPGLRLEDADDLRCGSRPCRTPRSPPASGASPR